MRLNLCNGVLSRGDVWMVEGRGEAREKSRRGETAKGGGRGGEGRGEAG